MALEHNNNVEDHQGPDLSTVESIAKVSSELPSKGLKELTSIRKDADQELKQVNVKIGEWSSQYGISKDPIAADIVTHLYQKQFALQNLLIAIVTEISKKTPKKKKVSTSIGSIQTTQEAEDLANQEAEDAFAKLDSVA